MGELIVSLDSKIEEIQTKQGERLNKIQKYRRLTNYLAAAQIYLKNNFLLKEPFKKDDIKDRLLGHWGTDPGINLIYAHLNRLIIDRDLDMFLITGPGHGAPANLSNLYLEGTLNEYYPELSLDEKGLGHFIKQFSWPGGFPSHLFPGIPGTIHEGGELGYSLATSFGAVLDNPDLIVACIVGDGEAETGPTATAWHSYKFIDPKESGAVLPIVHINGYKISNPTIYGTMSDEELSHLFTGYGYEVCFVEGEDLDAKIFAAFDWAYDKIIDIQSKARSGKKIFKPKWPVILLKSKKGMSGVKEMDGKPIEDSHRSHGVPIKDPKENDNHFQLLKDWLTSYKINELFDEKGRPIQELLDLCPKGNRRMGKNIHTFGGDIVKDLNSPSLKDFEVPVSRSKQHDFCKRGDNHTSNVHQVGVFLKEVFRLNPNNFRIFSPDELESNKLDSVFENTHRDYQWPTKPYDSFVNDNGGRVLEILSEHTCQAWLQGYVLTGRYGLFPSYESFLAIITTMMDQFAKFLKMSKDYPFRKPVPSLNYLETSTLWRQEHNGFSHQSPGFINSILNKKADIMRVYLPPDANCLISTMDHCIKSKNYVNLIITTKQNMPQWLSMEEAIAHCRSGASIWRWASIDEGVNPDVVFVGVGDNPTLEVMAATHILRQELPELKVRVVNVTDLLILEEECIHPHGVDDEMFDAFFTSDKPVIFNFHGYPNVLRQLLFNRPNVQRFQINGYLEEGTTTTPFDMNVRNKTSRFHLINQAIHLGSHHNERVAIKAPEMISHNEYVLKEHRKFIEKNGKDPDEITNWQWC